MKIYLLIALALWPAPGTAQTVQAGIDAWSRGDGAGALAKWRPLAEKGNPDAMFNLGQLHRLGRGVPIDLAEAEKWYTRAARAGHVDAQTQLGMMLFQNGYPRAAMSWLKRAADKGDARAQLLYGTALYNGDGVARRDVLLAYSYVAKSAAQGLGAARSTQAEMDRDIPPQLRRVAVSSTTRPAAPTAVAPAVASVPVVAQRPVAGPPSVVKSSVVQSSVVKSSAGTWRIQLGAFGQRAAAQALFARLEEGAPKGGPLTGKQPILVAAGPVTRLQVGPFASRAAATAACTQLAARGQPCFAVPAR